MGYRGPLAFLAQMSFLFAPCAAQGPAAPPPRLLVYPGDLTIVEETETVSLPEGASTVRLDFVRGNADVLSLDVVPLDHPAQVKVSAIRRKSELPNAVFLEVESKAKLSERLRWDPLESTCRHASLSIL